MEDTPFNRINASVNKRMAGALAEAKRRSFGRKEFDRELADELRTSTVPNINLGDLQALINLTLANAMAIDLMTFIEDLREHDEGACVVLHSSNRDFGGPNELVDYTAPCTGWVEQRFTGDTLLEALSAAKAFRIEKEGK